MAEREGTELIRILGLLCCGPPNWFKMASEVMLARVVSRASREQS